MPSPIGHSLMGYIIYRSFSIRVTGHQWLLVGACLFAANATDLDFLPGILIGDIGRFHHGPSHSIVSALMFGLLTATALPLEGTYVFAIGFLKYLSHVLMDYLMDDPSWPHGVPLFWPFSDEYYMAPMTVFRKFDYSPETAGLIATVFSIDNCVSVATEILVLLPVLAVVLWLKANNKPLQCIVPRSKKGMYDETQAL